MSHCSGRLSIRKLLHGRLILFALLWCSLPGGDITAQYRFDSWTTDNGLPQVSINSIIQTRDGFLWFTTFGGLVRYDGLRFQVFNTGNTEGLKTSRFGALLEDREGYLWINTEGQGVTCYKDGKFVTHTTKATLPEHIKNQIGEDAKGNLFLRVEEAISHPTGYVTSSEAPQEGEPTESVLQKTRNGAIWYSDGLGLKKFENGRVAVNYSLEFKVRRVFEDSQGRLWIAALDRNGLFMLKDGKLTAYSQKDGFPDFRFASAAEDLRGNVFFATPGGGLSRAKDERLTLYTTADGLIHNGVTKVYVDREGTIWAGTIGGLNRLTERAITSYSVPDGLAADNVYPIYQDRQGKIWIGSWNGLTVYEDGKFQNVGERFGVAGELLTALFEDREGNFWIGTWGGDALRVKDGRITKFPSSEIANSSIRAIYQDRQGDIWFGTANGLVKFADGAFTAFTPRDGISSKEFYAIYEDSSGRMWIGGDAGLNVYKDGVFTAFSEKDGIAANLVRAIYEDREGTLWIGTYDSGLYRFKDDRFTRYTTREGLFDNGAFAIIEDERENFWISCNLGIYRVRKSDLNDFAEGRIREIASIPYNKRDGMLNSECNGGTQPAAIKAADGRLWFPTQKGVAVINPDAVPFNSQPPPVVVESVVIDTKPIDINAPVRIEPGQTNLEIYYAGLSFINPELVKFKYRLEGLDEEWINAGTRRTAYYPHLPPGKYRFTVLAANRDNVWNEQGASIEITVLPAFWQTWWFRVLAVLTVFAAAFAFYRWRIGMLRRAGALRETFARQLIESQEDERKRIAVELHDSLGQSLVLIKNWALLGMNGNNRKDAPISNLTQISEMASEAIKEVREIAYNLGPYQLERLGLKKSVEEMVEKVASTSPIRFEVEIDEIDGRFTRQAEINIFRIIQEAANNIVKHSEASQAKVSVKTDASKATLIIQDNGKGFSAQESSNGNGRHGFGLLGMSERVHLLKGEYKIESEPGKGTTIIVYLAYEQSASQF